jgi:predicted O-methyltransferase YrrM
MYINPEIESSYQPNNLGESLYNTVLELQPNKIVEFGCLYGYSTVAMALALKELGRGLLYCYDLWDEYPYKHSTLDITKENIKKYGVENYVVFGKKDYFQWLQNSEQFDLMHLDISNTGDVISKTYDALYPQLSSGSTILFEGGSVERDNIEWMKKYKATSMNSVKTKTNYEVINPKFPSISKIKL